MADSSQGARRGQGLSDHDDPGAYLAPTYYVDSDAPQVTEFAKRATGGAHSDRDKAVALYYLVRDGLRYDPYGITADPSDYRASRVASMDNALLFFKLRQASLEIGDILRESRFSP